MMIMTDREVPLTAAQLQQRNASRANVPWWSFGRRRPVEANRADPAAPGSISLTP
jgi:hypothetical protein